MCFSELEVCHNTPAVPGSGQKQKILRGDAELLEKNTEVYQNQISLLKGRISEKSGVLDVSSK